MISIRTLPYRSMTFKQKHYSTKKVFLQAAAGVAAAAAVFAFWPKPAAAVEAGEKILRFAQDDKGTAAVGALVIPGKAAEPETEPEPLRHGGLSDAEIYRLKTERWEAAKAAEISPTRPSEAGAEEEEETPERQQPGLSDRAARAEVSTTKPWYTERELELVACTVYCEAGSDDISDETRMMVAQVVLNRVADDRFPDTIEDVLTQKSQYGRFYWTGVVWPSRAEHEPEAVERAYACAKRVLDGEWLLPSDVVYQAEFRQGHECVAHAPGFYFCR